jgi:hypothetical protein
MVPMALLAGAGVSGEPGVDPTGRDEVIHAYPTSLAPAARQARLGHNPDPQPLRRGEATVVPLMRARFHVTIPRCAPKCAHSTMANDAFRNLELIADQRLDVMATVLQKLASEFRLGQ